MLTVFLATLNDHKIHEVSKILSQSSSGSGEPLHLEIKTLAEFDLVGEWQETGTNFEQNAQIKAEFVRDHILALPGGRPKSLAPEQPFGILAEDSGICIAALGGQPGIHSKRFSGVTGGGQDAANNQHLLAKLAAHDDRRAHYHCGLVYWEPSLGFRPFEGLVHGVIAPEPRGSGGFGYDPLFIADGESQTFGELPEERKHKLSHRFQGVSAWGRWLRQEGRA